MMSNGSQLILFRLVRVAVSHRQRFLWTIAVMIGAVIFTVSLPELIGWAINTGLNLRIEDGIEIEPSWGQISLMCSMVMITAVIRGLLAYLQIYLGEALSQRVAYDLRNQLYDHLQHLSFGFHDKSEVGEIMQRATQDIEGIRFFVTMGVARFVFIALLIVSAVTLIVMENWRVGLVAIGFVPVVGIYASVMSLRMRPIWLNIVQLQCRMGTVL